jgi:enamine deaminase RidA (YjgF/YER057c/UK114 family)
MKKTFSNPPSLPIPKSYHHAVAVEGGRTIYLSGQVAFDAKRNVIGGDDIVAQTRQALRNMKTAVESAGGTMADIVQLTIHVVNFRPDQLDRIAGTLPEFFPLENLPANTLVGVSSLSTKGLLIEITGIAVTGPTRRLRPPATKSRSRAIAMPRSEA